VVIRNDPPGSSVRISAPGGSPIWALMPRPRRLHWPVADRMGPGAGLG
jgi:hypothetical protein